MLVSNERFQTAIYLNLKSSLIIIGAPNYSIVTQTITSLLVILTELVFEYATKHCSALFRVVLLIHIICAVSGCSLIRHIPDRSRRTFKLAVSYDMLVLVEQERSLMHYPKRFNWPQQSLSLRWLIPSRRGLR